ncbi:MAG: efflux RND transporter periplasmic adaptor subunit [Comamonas sp.]|jgi:multidrug efflux system membrane fusion protein|uniref:efflux RND transporter periplasmic adaptor subunit n=1 Tax=Comamonas sp. TaxID=34028 RepID=UPI0028313231|nr:efflux RND transporter periplasmic adaptor subunit [Comamonas sp.]MDR0213161.1 efflux RND transporter periplasmic adaptor subunit [Comamonas sp.]
MQETAPPADHPKTRRFIRWLSLVVLIAIGIAVWVHTRHAGPTKHGAQAQAVGVATATSGDMPEILNALGTVTPENTVTVLPQLSGYLTAVGYKEGEMVEKGQFLAQIDARQYEITLQQAQAQLAKDQAALAQAEADLQRYAQLNERKSIAPQTYADQQFLVKQQQAAIKADQAAIAQAKLNISLCHITAPVAGRVGLRLVDPGNYVTVSSQPGIVVITSVKPTTVEFNVPQASLSRVMQRFHSGEPLSVAAFNGDNNKQIASGVLYAIGNQMATSTGTIPLRARFANDDEALFPNDFVNVRLHVDTLRNVVLVPTAAVQSGAPGNFVFLVNADRNAVSVRKITIGQTDGKNTVVGQGLAVGDTVVVDGVDRLSDGALVKLQGKAPAH